MIDSLQLRSDENNALQDCKGAGTRDKVPLGDFFPLALKDEALSSLESSCDRFSGILEIPSPCFNFPEPVAQQLDDQFDTTTLEPKKKRISSFKDVCNYLRQKQERNELCNEEQDTTFVEPTTNESNSFQRMCAHGT